MNKKTSICIHKIELTLLSLLGLLLKAGLIIWDLKEKTRQDRRQIILEKPI